MNWTIGFGRRFCLIALSAGLMPLTGCVFARGQRYHHFTTPTPVEENKILILGFLGGREPWNNPHRNVRKLALKLGAQYPDKVRIETVENKKRHLALDLIRRAFDRNRDGQLDAQERAGVRLILYGQSFGGAAVVKLARELERMGAPVILTVQVDSVGRGDRIIPANVARAANLFQRNGLFIRGEPEIRAQDPSRTAVIGNFEFDYQNKKIDLSEESWMKKLFRDAHTRMDFDPAVWALVEELIVKELSRLDDERRVTRRFHAWMQSWKMVNEKGKAGGGNLTGFAKITARRFRKEKPMSEITFEQVLSQVKALPPEDAAKLRDYLNSQIQQDEAIEEARALARATSMRDLSDEYRWIEANREEYAGRWVALKGSQLISSGPNGVEVIRAARDAGFPDAFIKLVLPAEQIKYTVF